jgi:class 3 adenylate cyclase
MAAITWKSLDDPDVERVWTRGRGSMAHVGVHTIGRGVLEPGWRWSEHMGPLMGTSSCPIHHLQIVLSGRFAVRMDDSEDVVVLKAGDVVDIPPGHDAWVDGDEPCVLLDVGGNVEGIGLPREHERIVTTLLMTDIVDSTATASRMGDAAWKQVLNDHNRVVRAQFVQFSGTEVNTTGDGFLATFRSAVGGLRCAGAIRDALFATGIEVRAGVHTGEVEIIGNDIGGVAVHAVARIMALAGPRQVFASSATVGLAEGNGLDFEARGARDVKGLDRPIEVFELR